MDAMVWIFIGVMVFAPLAMVLFGYQWFKVYSSEQTAAVFTVEAPMVEPRDISPVTVVTTPTKNRGEDGIASQSLTGPEQKILNALAWLESIGNTEPEATAVAFLAGYTFGGGGFNNPRGALRTKGLIEYRGRNLALTDEGRANAKVPDTALTQGELHAKVLSVLPAPEQRVLKPLLDA